MIYEMRTYTAVPGRLPDVLRRFETQTIPIWDQYGIRLVGMWTTVIGPDANELRYILAWESLAAREEKWTAFVRDPNWVEARTESEKNGQIVAKMESVLLAPTAFSPTV